MKAAKARGVVLGNPNLVDVRECAVANIKADAERFALNLAPVIREIQSSGIPSHRGIARALNARGVATARGGEWTAVQVGSTLRRADRLSAKARRDLIMESSPDGADCKTLMNRVRRKPPRQGKILSLPMCWFRPIRCPSWASGGQR